MILKPRGWQGIALEKFKESKDPHFLLDATPGCGKTLFAAFAAEHRFECGDQFAIIIVPNIAIKGGKHAGFVGDWHKVGIEIKDDLDGARAAPTDYRGAVITYQKLPNLIGIIETWVRNGLRLFSVFDEIHHASDNEWGAAAETLGLSSTHILSMTGTCFRADGHRISFVNYDAAGKAIPDYHYGYRQAVADRVCRKVDFVTDDSVTEFAIDGENHEVRVSEAKTDDELSGATSTVFDPSFEFLSAVIDKADDELDQYRTWDLNAGGLIICRPGRDEGADIRHLHKIAKLVEERTGEKPEVISYDDEDSTAKIDRFREGEQLWLCAVRKVSEGVDIKRLRVEVMATRPKSELLFRQLVGRVVRVDDERNPGDATVFIAAFKELEEWAKAIAEEARAGLAKRRENGGNGGGDGAARDFMSFGANHEQSGAISDYGERFSRDEVNQAERMRSGDPQLAGVAITVVAHILRKFNVPPEPNVPVDPPMQIVKDQVRRKIVKLHRQLAHKRNPPKPEREDFKQIWTEIRELFGPYNMEDLENNYTIEVMRQIEDWLIATLVIQT